MTKPRTYVQLTIIILQITILSSVLGGIEQKTAE
jgi:hypothetical protein